MALKITKGPRKTAVRAVLYGTEGIGKSELATLLPRPLVLDAEGSTNQLDCERSDLTTWPETLGALATLGSTAHDYQTVAIDTADFWQPIQLLSQAVAQCGDIRSSQGQ